LSRGLCYGLLCAGLGSLCTRGHCLRPHRDNEGMW
jgi:hypothetical protein